MFLFALTSELSLDTSWTFDVYFRVRQLTVQTNCHTQTNRWVELGFCEKRGWFCLSQKLCISASLL